MEIGEPKKTHTNVPQPEELPFIELPEKEVPQDEPAGEPLPGVESPEVEPERVVG